MSGQTARFSEPNWFEISYTCERAGDPTATVADTGGITEAGLDARLACIIWAGDCNPRPKTRIRELQIRRRVCTFLNSLGGRSKPPALEWNGLSSGFEC